MHISRFLAIILFILVLSSLSFAKEPYNYPIDNPIDASFTFSLLTGQYRGWKNYIMVRDKNNERPQGYTGPTGYPINCFFHSDQREAPLVLLLVGLGGDVSGNGALYIASRLFRNGYHVVIVPSTFTDDFLYTVSDHYYVGQAKSDSIDQYKALKKVKEFVLSKGVKVSSWKLFGYSFGAAIGAFVSEIEANNTKDKLGIDKYILLNPPTDILEGLTTVDDFASTDISRKFFKFFKVFEAIFKFRLKHDAEEIPEHFRMSPNVRSQDLKYFIGKSLRSSLAGIITFTQETLNLGILKGSTFQSRKIKAKKYSLSDYVHLFLRKFYETTDVGRLQWQNIYGTNSYDLNRLRHENSLYRLEDNLHQNNKVYIVHNTDDFLLSPVDVNFLKETMKERFILYPKGGHVGNVWYKENFSLYLKLLAD